MRILIDRLRLERTLSDDELRSLLLCDDSSVLEYLRTQARQVAQQKFGRSVFVRGLIEITSYCRNNCLYCGIRGANLSVERYRLSREQILDCCRVGYELGLRTFVLQGGEDPAMSDEWIADTVAEIHRHYWECAVTLSLGERSAAAYEAFAKAGAVRYLLRHETADRTHYSKLHPSTMSLDSRVACLAELKRVGFQTGTGMMIGSPYQTVDNIVQDIRFIERLQPEMIGIGPFIPHRQTPFARFAAGDFSLTLKVLALLRLMHPNALIPSTTALATLTADGREAGILSGANVVMPNLSPPKFRERYSLYDRKASCGAEAVEGLAELQSRLERIGYVVSFDRGDYSKADV